MVDPEYSGREGDKNYIVDRGCLGGGPDDGKDRCFEVTSYHGSPPGYLCVCKGDLCNGARTSTPAAFWTVGLGLASALAALGMLSHWSSYLLRIKARSALIWVSPTDRDCYFLWTIRCILFTFDVQQVKTYHPYNCYIPTTEMQQKHKLCAGYIPSGNSSISCQRWYYDKFIRSFLLIIISNFYSSNIEKFFDQLNSLILLFVCIPITMPINNYFALL